MASKADLKKAYVAGQALRMTPNTDLPEEAVAEPVAACPFAEGTEERVQWLQGYADAHEQENTSAASIRKALSSELELQDGNKRKKVSGDA